MRRGEDIRARRTTGVFEINGSLWWFSAIFRKVPILMGKIGHDCFYAPLGTTHRISLENNETNSTD